MRPYSLDDIDEDVDDDDGFYEDDQSDEDDEDGEDDEDEDEETWQVSNPIIAAKVQRLLDIGQRTA
jgi:hypothetical protein